MTTRLQAASKHMLSFVDWFIPPGLKANVELAQSARMFLFSHLFGPFLGHTISIYVLIVTGRADMAWWTFFGAITLFWPFTIVLRVTGLYLPLALISIENLLFCILWGVYHYGGISSPILPWLITVPLLAFFYLPTARTRIIVSLLIVANLVAFYFIYSSLGFPETIPLRKLVGLGIVSTFCAGMYVSMMALYYSNIVSSQSELEQEVKRHRETERELRMATEQVERATLAKSEFLAKMSHELRNPLNAIIGYSEMMLEDTPAGEQKAADLQSIKGAGYKLLELVSDLLDLSKLEAGKMELHLRQISLGDFIDEAVAAWRTPIEDNGNEFRVDRPSELGDVIIDATKLRQALDNLLSNATKFTRDGCVTLSASSGGGLVVVSVRDTGPGIAPEHIGSLFETFSSSDHETASNYGHDAGLGLPLSQRLCRLMEGNLLVESVLGRGACFTIEIPSRLADAARPEAQLVQVEAPALADGHFPRSPILVIDDDRSMLGLVERTLAKEGFASILCSELTDGLARAMEMTHGVIILDVGMQEPGSGWQALKSIKEDPRTRGCKVMLLTADDDFAKGLALGADAHLLKPLDRAALLQHVKDLYPSAAHPTATDAAATCPAAA